MEEWKEYRLGDIIAIKSGFAYKGSMIGFGENVLLGMGSVSFKERFLLSGARPYAGDCADRYCAHVGDIVLATRQQSDNLPILGMPAIIPNELSEKKIIIGANLYRVDNESDFSNEYIYWLLKTPLYVNHIRSCQSGTTVRMITKANIEDFRFKAPGRKERDRISHFLKSLDEKIEVNRRINDNLEQQAQALFKSWFVDFEPFRDQPFVESELGMIPQGWRVGTLSDLANITMGTSPSGTSYNVSGEGEVFYQGRAEFGYRFPHRNLFTTEPKRYAEEGNILLSVRAPVGDVNIANERCCIGRGLAAIGSNNYPSYILYLVKSLKSVFEQYNGEGTVFGSINKKTLEGLRIIVPEIRYIEKFEEIANPLDSQIRNKEEESRRLAELRDTLLPRLMSGELSVDGLKGQFAVSPGRCPGSKEHVSNKTAL